MQQEQLDPFIIYTVKLTMDFKSISNDTNFVVHDPLDSNDNTMMRILEMKPNRIIDTHMIPKLQKENILSLLYHADEQWITSLSNNNITLIHQQQAIYLDTLYLLYKSFYENHQSLKRFNESIWFACQVLHNKFKIKHLESFTSQLVPLSSNLYQSMLELRFILNQTCQQQYKLKNKFIYNYINFYSTRENQNLMSSIKPAFDNFLNSWFKFENQLYICYIHIVFGEKYYLNHIQSKPIITQSKLPFELFNDSLTKLLPLTLNRALHHSQLISLHDLQSLDPIAFISLPRLTILAGLTWLSHLTGWRTSKKTLPHWIQHHSTKMSELVKKIQDWEKTLLDSSCLEDHELYVQNYLDLEMALVHGQTDKVEKSIYLDICHIADSSLQTKSFTMALCCLFNQQEYDIDIYEEDAIPIEQAILNLAI